MEYWSKIIPILLGLKEKGEITSMARLFEVIKETTVFDQKGLLSYSGLRGFDHLLNLNTWLIQSGLNLVAENFAHDL